MRKRTDHATADANIQRIVNGATTERANDELNTGAANVRERWVAVASLRTDETVLLWIGVLFYGFRTLVSKEWGGPGTSDIRRVIAS